jgi:hypothetical protein
VAWLLREGDVLAALEERRPGWQQELQGAVVVRPPAWVHTLSCPAGLDVAWCVAVSVDGAARLEVRRTAYLPGRRLARPRLARGAIVVARSGAFDRWRLRVGDRLEVRDSP